MNAITHAVMLGWIPVVFAIFSVLPPRRAVITAFLTAYLFLPMAAYTIPGLPDYTKMSATCFGIAACALMMDASRLMAFRLRLIDAPMIWWCLAPLLSAITAGYGLYEGVSGVFSTTVDWGAPYLLGRLYLGDRPAMHEFLTGLVIGGIAYTPLVLFELKMSPQLHTMVYGWFPHSFAQTVRFGGWRPQVFMQHGLAVGMFMCTAALAAFALALSGARRSLWGVPMWCVAGGLLVMAMLVKSTGAAALLVGGAGTLVAMKWTRSSWPLAALLCAPVGYIVARTVLGWEAQEVIDLAHSAFGEHRAQSLETRITSETLLWREVQPYLLFGACRFIWSGVVYDGIMLIPDGMWIIALGTQGILGLGAFLGLMIGPAAALAARLRRAPIAEPGAACVMAAGVMLGLYMVDCLMNAMINPIFLLAAGGVASLASQPALGAAAQRTPVRLVAAPTPRAAGEGRAS